MKVSKAYMEYVQLDILHKTENPVLKEGLWDIVFSKVIKKCTTEMSIRIAENFSDGNSL